MAQNQIGDHLFTRATNLGAVTYTCAKPGCNAILTGGAFGALLFHHNGHQCQIIDLQAVLAENAIKNRIILNAGAAPIPRRVYSIVRIELDQNWFEMQAAGFANWSMSIPAGPTGREIISRGVGGNVTFIFGGGEYCIVDVQ